MNDPYEGLSPEDAAAIRAATEEFEREESVIRGVPIAPAAPSLARSQPSTPLSDSAIRRRQVVAKKRQGPGL